MALVVTNGIFYIVDSGSGNIEKVEEENKASQFISVSKAVQFIKGGGNKTRHDHVYDTETHKVCWQSQKRRKHYSPKVRKMIYDKAGGRCALCGRKITLSDMTIDHIVPLNKNGEDSINNLQSTCLACNRFKANIRPDDFMNRITTIFIYQMGKKYGGKISWKIAYKALENII